VIGARHGFADSASGLRALMLLRIYARTASTATMSGGSAEWTTLLVGADLRRSALGRSAYVPGTRHQAAFGGIRLHTPAVASRIICAGQKLFGQSVEGAPSRIRTCAHGSGEGCRVSL
jgi:hypothetical protein